MKKTFKKDNIKKTFNVEGNKVIATVQLTSGWISNPTLDAFLNDGWEEYTEPEVEPVKPKYTERELVEQYMRIHGYPTPGSELAVVFNYLENKDNEHYIQEYEQHKATREAAKKWAKEQLGITEEETVVEEEEKTTTNNEEPINEE